MQTQGEFFLILVDITSGNLKKIIDNLQYSSGKALGINWNW